MNFGNSAVIKSCVKELQVSFAKDPSKWKKLKRLVFEQGKDPVVQWLSCIIIQKQIMLSTLKWKVHNLRELKQLNANSM